MIRKVPFLKGAFTPLVVPFKSGAVDYDQYVELIEWQIAEGTHGLLVNATSGVADYAHTGRESATDRGCCQNIGGPRPGGRWYSRGIAF
jgi:hypothetical protein